MLEMDLAERETWSWYGDAGVSSHVFILGWGKGQCKRWRCLIEKRRAMRSCLGEEDDG